MSRKRDNDFVNGVLGRTTGSACERAVSLLPALTDGALGDLDRRLVQSHLEHCGPCRHTAVVMGWLGGVLPEMAVVEPGPGFTAGVVARTTGAMDPMTRAVRAGRPAGPAGLMDRLGRWWEEQIFKPRFAMQVAYVATAILVLLTAWPGAPLKDTPGRALAIVQAGPTQAPLVGPALALLDAEVTGLIVAGRGLADRTVTGIRTDLSERAARSAPARSATAAQFATGLDAAGEGRLGPAGYAFLQAARSSGDVVGNWWRTAPSAADSIQIIDSKKTDKRKETT